ncbi:MAG: TlpA family protein disulfide reductase [Bacteroidota bacterium]|nr:TlpA family protein disulfide reductase [Bacteroidota bacterium]MDX5429990.1 TlpA family protein disulfide reductase [Bacteroidota bacterium]MDX5468763.1 TlpA family protein disulfide reductase [Bacteroidota bacterium]
MKQKGSILIPVILVIGLAVAFSFSSKPSAQVVRTAGPGIGDMAPEISMADANGKMYSLSSLKGKIVLVDFWASWCQPCRKENPNLVRTYEKYHNARFKNAREFTIFSVSLDDDMDKWQRAISKDGLNWEYHVSDLMRWSSPAAANYGVESIPSNYLLDETGKIIAINLRGKDLDKALKSLQ